MRLHNCTSASEIRDRFLPGRPQLNSFHDEWLREPSHSQANWWWSWTGSSGRLCTWHWHWIYTQTNIGTEPTRPRWLDIFAYVSANGCDECVPPPPAIHSSASCSYVRSAHSLIVVTPARLLKNVSFLLKRIFPCLLLAAWCADLAKVVA